MKVLAIEISCANGSVAVAENGRILAEVRFEAPRGRGAKVFSALEQLRPQWAGLARVAIGLGPGSYNGLRVACALASSFQAALGADVVSAPSPCLLGVEATNYFAVGDARGGLAYLAEVQDRKLAAQIDLVPHARIAAHRGKPVFRVGSIGGQEGLPEACPSAALLALLAPSLEPLDSGPLKPIYLKPPHITAPRPVRG